MHLTKHSFLVLRVLTIIFAIIGLLFVFGFIAIKTGLTKTAGVVTDRQQESFLKIASSSYPIFPLEHTPEWISFRVGVAKDRAHIERVSRETGVPARILIAPLVSEQMRLFHSERPTFKKVFEPLKILGSQSQFSWGIMGIKEGTAREVEKNLKDPTSPAYLGPEYEHLLDLTTDNPDQERFARIVDPQNHYYGYLYGALFIREIETAWAKAGYDISARPDIIATLYNLGFSKSVPKASPQVGGAEIQIGEKSFSFGELAGLFYASDELIELFPQS